MTLGSRRRMARLLIALFVLWPPVQHLLSRHAEVHPWKLFGFGMYSTYYSSRPTVSVTENGRVLPLDEAVPEMAAAAVSFSKNRAILGKLAPEERFAREILRTSAGIEEVRVSVETRRLDPVSAMIVRENSERIYRRDDR